MAAKHYQKVFGLKSKVSFAIFYSPIIIKLISTALTSELKVTRKETQFEDTGAVTAKLISELSLLGNGLEEPRKD